jgi:bacterioferritin (cytochrome b1)
VPDRYKPTYDNMIIFENKKMMSDALNDILSIRINIVNQYFLHILSKDSLIEELEEL